MYKDLLKWFIIPLIPIMRLLTAIWISLTLLCSCSKEVTKEKINKTNEFEDYKIELSKTKEKICLALITTSDHNNATQWMENMFYDDFKDIPSYKLITFRVSSKFDVFNIINDIGRFKKIDCLILALHWSQWSMSLQLFESLTWEEKWTDYWDSFSVDPRIILYSCSTWKWDTNVATLIQQQTGIEVIAPKMTLIPETDIKQDQREWEFIEQDWKVDFNYQKFKYFEKLVFKWSVYYDCVATDAYPDGKNIPANKLFSCYR